MFLFVQFYSYLCEKERQHGEYRRLYESHEGLKREKRHWKNEGYEEHYNKNEHLTGKYVAEKPERERYKTHEF